MRTERRNELVLAALALVLVFVLYRTWPRTPEQPGASPSAAVPGSAARTPAPPSIKAPDVHLDALAAERPKPGDNERNLFRFKPKPVPPPPQASLPVAATPAPAVPSGPPPPPPLPPIPLKFIGVVESPQQAQRIAVLSDERGVYHGREGDIIEGRYRIIRIGVESVDLAYVDGRGRQTIRLTGS